MTPSYWTRSLERSQLVEGHVFAHGTTRMNLAPGDITAFVEPADAALMFGFRALSEGDDFAASFPVWMLTLRRRDATSAIVESLQRIYTQLVDDGSLVDLIVETAAHARKLGYAKLWFSPSVLGETLLAPSLKAISERLGKPIAVVPTSGMFAIDLT